MSIIAWTMLAATQAGEVPHVLQPSDFQGDPNVYVGGIANYVRWDREGQVTMTLICDALNGRLHNCQSTDTSPEGPRAAVAAARYVRLRPSVTGKVSYTFTFTI